MTDAKADMRVTPSSSQPGLDETTNAYMRKVIGERLSQHLGTDAPMPERLQRLLDQLRLQDRDAD